MFGSDSGTQMKSGRTKCTKVSDRRPGALLLIPNYLLSSLNVSALRQCSMERIF